jgi:Putative phage metallopeptidase
MESNGKKKQVVPSAESERCPTADVACRRASRPPGLTRIAVNRPPSGRNGVSESVNVLRTPLPAVYRWGPGHPLPIRPVRLPVRARPQTIGLDCPPWLATGPVEQPFDFCQHTRDLCADIVARCPELAHIEVNRLLFAVTQARGARRHGLQARVTPLRFRHGLLIRARQGIRYQVQRYFIDNQEMLYLITFCLPRFLDQSFDDKFVTLFHELYHISPGFEGDLRRLEGRCTLHTQSQRAYDAHMARLARAYLAQGPDARLHAFLRMNFAQLQHRHGSVVGVVVPRPRLLPLNDGVMP